MFTEEEVKTKIYNLEQDKLKQISYWLKLVNEGQPFVVISAQHAFIEQLEIKISVLKEILED